MYVNLSVKSFECVELFAISTNIRKSYLLFEDVKDINPITKAFPSAMGNKKMITYGLILFLKM